MTQKRGAIRFKGLIITLAIVASLSLVTLFSKTFMYQDEILRLSADFITLEEKMQVKAGNWTHYLEKRINGLAQRQDEFQYSTSERMRILEDRMNKATSQSSQNKNVNINNINVK